MATKSNNKVNAPKAKAPKAPYTGSKVAQNALKSNTENRWDLAYVIETEATNYGNRSAVHDWFAANSDYSPATIKAMDDAARVAIVLIKGRHCTRIQLNKNGSPSTFRMYLGSIKGINDDKDRLAKVGNDVKAGKAIQSNTNKPKGRNGGNKGRNKTPNSPQFDPEEAIKTVNKFVETAANAEMVDLVCKVMARIETNILSGESLKDGQVRKIQAQMTSLASAHIGAKAEPYKLNKSA